MWKSDSDQAIPAYAKALADLRGQVTVLEEKLAALSPEALKAADFQWTPARLDAWLALQIEPAQAPEDWSGSMDIERDDYGVDLEITAPNDNINPLDGVEVLGRDFFVRHLDVEQIFDEVHVVLHHLMGEHEGAGGWGFIRGGMGAILRVWDEDLQRSLAMKVLPDASWPGSPCRRPQRASR